MQHAGKLWCVATVQVEVQVIQPRAGEAVDIFLLICVDSTIRFRALAVPRLPQAGGNEHRCERMRRGGASPEAEAEYLDDKADRAASATAAGIEEPAAECGVFLFSGLFLTLVRWLRKCTHKKRVLKWWAFQVGRALTIIRGW